MELRMNLYWGDLHNHCGISYGYGSLSNALSAARKQLDFCAIIGHASWYDIPARTEELAFLVDFHEKGFAKLAAHWDQVRETVKLANVPHEFVTFQGYEAHSSEFGDHHFLSPDDDLPLVSGKTPGEIVAKLQPRRVIAIPHHVGYTRGYRGGNWENFDGRISPVVEVYSKHGSGMSDQSLFPYYHDMGPRDSRSTVFHGLQQGKRFGFVGSTDHHAGYPGSYGDGRLAVWAEHKTRDSIWEAILARRTYAVTGDKIDCRFQINGAPMGSELNAAGSRSIVLDVRACDAIDQIIVYKNLRPWRIVNSLELGKASVASVAKPQTYKVRVEMGWGNALNGFHWDGCAAVRDGQLISVETCFRGRSVLAPTPDMKDSPALNDFSNRITGQSGTSVVWSCTTFKNPTTLHSHTAALILEIAGDPMTVLDVQINGKQLTFSIGELIQGSRSAHLQTFNSEAILVHRAIARNQYDVHRVWEDVEQEQACDIYHVEVRQMNQQCAWISPIYVG
jgi:hypothetical protein